MNQVVMSGNVANEPELRYTPSGLAVTKFNLAVNSTVRNSDGSFEDRLDGFFQVVAWRTLAENAAASIHKGTRVTVAGKLGRRTWEAEDGSKRFAVEITAEEIALSLKFTVAEATRYTPATEPESEQEAEEVSA